MARTRVYVTIDVECAEERRAGGRSLPALDYDARVWGRFRNQRQDLGIGLIMGELEAQGLRGTFFTEVLGSQTFGIDGLRRIVGEIRGRGHDVQLHAHPIQRCARYRSLGRAPVVDDIGAYPLADQVAQLDEAIAILVGCGVARDEVRAFRAGNYGASNTTWAAMAAVGIPLSSSYNPCYFERNCRLRFADSRPGLFRAEHGIFELPISNFVECAGRHRHLQITAVSLAEMTRYLDDARRMGIGEVTIVTHSFEFAHLDPRDPGRAGINRINLRRLRGLCRFLRDRDAAFEVETVGALAARLHAGDTVPVTAATELPRGRRRDRARRLIEQGLKRMEAKLP